MTLKKLSPSDTQLVEDFFKELNWQSGLYGGNWSAESLIEELNHEFWGLIHDGKLVASLAGRRVAEDFELFFLGVIPIFVGKGLGALLFKESLHNIPAVAWYLEVADSNDRAMAFYKNFGFETIGSRKEYYSSGAAALVLKKDIACN